MINKQAFIQGFLEKQASLWDKIPVRAENALSGVLIGGVPSLLWGLATNRGWKPGLIGAGIGGAIGLGAGVPDGPIDIRTFRSEKDVKNGVPNPTVTLRKIEDIPALHQIGKETFKTSPHYDYRIAKKVLLDRYKQLPFFSRMYQGYPNIFGDNMYSDYVYDIIRSIDKGRKDW